MDSGDKKQKNSILSKLNVIKEKLPNPNSFSSISDFTLKTVIKFGIGFLAEAKNALKESFAEIREEWNEFVREMRGTSISESSTELNEKQGNIDESQVFDPLGITGCKSQKEYNGKKTRG